MASAHPLSVITGGTRGIGAAVARHLAALGHDLVLAHRSDDDSARALTEALRTDGRVCRAVRADVTDPAQVDALFDLVAEVGPVTAVVNNAGATMHMGDLEDTPVEVVRRVVDLNLTAALLVARRAVRDLTEGGVLVNVSSAAASLGSPHEYVHYAAAKAGVDALTVGLAQEVADRGIRVVGVAPGIVRTAIHADAGDPDRIERVSTSVPLGRAAEPDEVGAAIAWLLSDAASYVTGTTLRVAGGR